MSLQLMTKHIRFNVLTAGRTGFGARGVQSAAGEGAPPRLRDLLVVLLAVSDKALEVRKRWRSVTRKVEAAALAQQLARLDSDTDATIGSMFAVLLRAATTLPARNRLRAVAQALINEHFPEGADAITKLSYADELATGQLLHKELSAPELAADLVALGVMPYLEELGDYLPTYAELSAAINAHKGSVTYDEVVMADRAMRRATLQLVAWLFAEYAEDEETLSRLFKPLGAQHEAVSQARRRRRAVRDVNPVTGEELEDEDAEQPVADAEQPAPVEA